MDRNRLKEVHQTDLTEGRINQDFVDWLKTKGTSWLLVGVIALFAYAVWVRWSNYRANYKTEAWAALSQATLPSSYEDVAEKYTDVGAVSHMARLKAGEQLIAAVQSGQTLGAETDAKTPLDDKTRVEYLDRADRMFAKVVDADNGGSEMALLVSNALLGRGAVAESKGEADVAREYYNKAADRVASVFPQRAEKARARAAAVDAHATTVTIPTREEVFAMDQKSTLPAAPEQIWIEPWLTDLVSPKP